MSMSQMAGVMLKVPRGTMINVARTLAMSSGGSSDLGGGSGRGGGAGGSVRAAGGAFGKLEAGREEEYFRKLQAAQLKNLKGDLDREIEHHRKQLEQHQAAIARHERRIKEIAREEEQLKGGNH
uniref:ATPase inhibitor, mitochondrial n=1 Tax=Plectus sambesii TaxID=2011161 RepID=A0A914WJD9_9BILA